MQRDPAPSPEFVVSLLEDLRAGRYGPAAWWRFLARSWAQSRATARAHPRLVRSWAAASCAQTAGALGAVGLEWRSGRAFAARRIFPWVVLGLAAQQMDVYVHLGLNGPTRGAPVRESLGLPTSLTLSRQTIATLLWAHLLGRCPVPRGYALAALVGASVTDVADGALARRLDHATYLGRYLDAEADMNVSTVLACTLSESGHIPAWLTTLLLGRWLLPVVAGMARYLGQAQPVLFGSSLLGKAAGVAQSVTLGAALLPTQTPRVVARLRPVLVGLAVTCLIAAPLGQLRRLRRRQ